MPKLTAVRKRAIDEIIKDAVFHAAVDVLTERGVEGLTMDRVAATAGVAKGSLYKYFSGKRELFQFVYAGLLDPFVEDLDAIVATKQSAMEKLVTHMRNTLQLAAGHGRVFRLLFSDDTARMVCQPTERTTREAICHRLAAIFSQGIEEGVFRPADPLMLARMFIGLGMGVFEGHPDLEGIEGREKIRQLIMSSFLNGVATPAGRIRSPLEDTASEELEDTASEETDVLDTKR
jgi:AcrR family transcriptional regulator